MPFGCGKEPFRHDNEEAFGLVSRPPQLPSRIQSRIGFKPDHEMHVTPVHDTGMG